MPFWLATKVARTPVCCGERIVTLPDLILSSSLASRSRKEFLSGSLIATSPPSSRTTTSTPRERAALTAVLSFELISVHESHRAVRLLELWLRVDLHS